MKKIAICVALVALAGCSKTVYVSDTTTKQTTTTTEVEVTTEAPAETRPDADYSSSNNYTPTYDPAGYDTFIYDSAYSFWAAFSTEDLLQMGLVVCDTFDSGATLDDVTSVLIASMTRTGTLYAMEGVAAMTAGALTFLCPEHSWWLETL